MAVIHVIATSRAAAPADIHALAIIFGNRRRIVVPVLRSSALGRHADLAPPNGAPCRTFGRHHWIVAPVIDRPSHRQLRTAHSRRPGPAAQTAWAGGETTRNQISAGRVLIAQHNVGLDHRALKCRATFAIELASGGLRWTAGTRYTSGAIQERFRSDHGAIGRPGLAAGPAQRFRLRRT